MASTVFKDGMVFRDGGFDSADVLIEELRIVSVGSDLSGEQPVDATDHVLLPGLFDTHIHMGYPGTDVLDLAKSVGEGPEVRVLRFPETASKTLGFGHYHSARCQWSRIRL